MEYIFESLTCPTCGANISASDTVCICCGGTFVRKIVNRVTNCLGNQKGSNNTKLGLNPEVITNIQTAIELLDERKPFLCDRKTIDKCIKNLDAVYEDFPDAVIDYFRAYIEYDYFERKHLNRNPGYLFFWDRAMSMGITEEEIFELEKALKNKINFKGEK